MDVNNMQISKQNERRPVKRYESFYSVDTNGNIYSLKTGKKLKWLKSYHTPPYPMVNLSGGSRKSQKTHLIHRIVAEAFVLGQDENLEVNHKDGNRWNPKASNLEWVTKSENKLHSLNITHLSKPPCLKGEDSGRSKLTESQIKSIRIERESGTTVTDLARRYGVTHQNISDICNGNSWHHSFQQNNKTTQKGE